MEVASWDCRTFSFVSKLIHFKLNRLNLILKMGVHSFCGVLIFVIFEGIETGGGVARDPVRGIESADAVVTGRAGRVRVPGTGIVVPGGRPGRARVLGPPAGTAEDVPGPRSARIAKRSGWNAKRNEIESARVSRRSRRNISVVICGFLSAGWTCGC
jgi:hypothetical protein